MHDFALPLSAVNLENLPELGRGEWMVKGAGNTEPARLVQGNLPAGLVRG
jgi:hypothetical protein